MADFDIEKEKDSDHASLSEFSKPGLHNLAVFGKRVMINVCFFCFAMNGSGLNTLSSHTKDFKKYEKYESS